MNKQSGLTLVELLVVVAILSMSVSAFSLLNHVTSYKNNLEASDVLNEIVEARNLSISKKTPHIIIFKDKFLSIVEDSNFSGSKDDTDQVIKNKILYESTFNLKSASIPGDNEQRYVVFTPSGGISDNTLRNGRGTGDLVVEKDNSSKKTLKFRVSGHVKTI